MPVWNTVCWKEKLLMNYLGQLSGQNSDQIVAVSGLSFCAILV